MNIKKRNFELAAAILSIIFSVLGIVSVISLWNYYTAAYGAVVFLVVLIMLGIAILIISILLCLNPLKNGRIKNTKGLVITLLTLTSSFLFISIFLSASILGVLLYVMIAVIVLTGVSLNFKYDNNHHSFPNQHPNHPHHMNPNSYHTNQNYNTNQHFTQNQNYNANPDNEKNQ